MALLDNQEPNLRRLIITSSLLTEVEKGDLLVEAPEVVLDS